METSSRELQLLLDEKDRIEIGGRLHWFHWLIVLSSLLLTIGAWYFAKTQVNLKAERHYNREVDRVLDLISERMQKYEDVLWGGVASMRAHNHGMNYDEWKRYSETLRIEEKYPGINGLGVIYQVPSDKKADFLAQQRLRRPLFKIHPPHDEKELLPITYIEPVKNNAAAVGLDMSHEENRYSAAKKARDTGDSQITGPIVLVQDAQKTPGFLFYAPFYKEDANIHTVRQKDDFVGLVYAPFIFHRLMEGALKHEGRHVGIKIIDDGTVLFDENHTGIDGFDPDPMYQTITTVEMYGRHWNFEILSKLSFKAAHATYKPWVILLAGIIIDSLLLGLFVFLARSNRRAVDFSSRMAEGYQSRVEHLSNVINEAIDGLITIDMHGIVRSFNPACEKMFGYTADEIIGQNVKVLMPDDYLEEQNKSDGQEAGVHSSDVVGRTKDGRIFPLEFSLSEIHSEKENLYSAIMRDITDRKNYERKIEDKQKFQNLIFSTLPDILFVKDEEFRIVEANDAFLALYPEDMRDSVIGMSSIENYSKEDAEEFVAQDRIAFDKGYSEIEETITFPTGETRTYFTKKVRFENNDGAAFILGVGRDITKMKKTEEELVNSNEELERFAYVASHDLQEPLRMVTNFTSLLSKRYAEQLDDTAQEYLGFAYDGAVRMQTLVADLLEYARLGGEAERYSVVDVNEIMPIVLGNLAEAITVSKAKVTYDDLPILYTNPVGFISVMQNLIGNGLKYQEPETVPEIHVAVRKEDNEWVFSIADNGIGMKQESAEKIFEPFKRLHGKGTYSGTGMGLAICRKIIESFGGRVWMESELGKGSVFHFSMPIHEES